uniref:Uncharacterized protein n=1 Tax=Oryza rufipogon TaxID=4529 RepID=A0A0E0PBJ2_ORYRU
MAVAAATRIAVVVVVLALAVLAPAARGLRRDDFPPGFLFGAATSAYQIEGAYLDDNKGLNNWDVFTHLQVGRISDGRNGATEEFEYYSDVCFNAFGDRVRFWTTFNEPNLSTRHQYILGEFPPNHCSPPFGNCSSGDSRREPYAAAHNILLSHAAAFTPEEKKLLQNNKVDFIGINHYTAIYAKDCIYSPCTLDTYEGNALVYAIGRRNGKIIGKPTALHGYFVVPEAMEKVVMYVNDRYRNTTIYITENGYSQHSDTSMEDLINDVERVNYMHDYLKYLSSAIRKGANVGGYFAWSIVDNFEWVYGYTVKFGLYQVDFDTQERIPRMSAKWYRDFLTSSSLTDGLQVRSRRADS